MLRTRMTPKRMNAPTAHALHAEARSDAQREQGEKGWGTAGFVCVRFTADTSSAGGGAAGKCASLGGLLTSCPANGPATLWFFLFCYLPGLRPAARAPLRVFPSFRSPAPKLPRTRAAALRSAGASLSSRAGHAMLCVGPQGSRRGEAVRGRRARPASPLWLWRASRARTCKPLMLCNRRRAAYTTIMYISICII